MDKEKELIFYDTFKENFYLCVLQTVMREAKETKRTVGASCIMFYSKTISSLLLPNQKTLEKMFRQRLRKPYYKLTPF